MVNNNIKRVLKTIFSREQLNTIYNKLDVNKAIGNIMITSSKEKFLSMAIDIKDTYLSDDINIKLFQDCEIIIGKELMDLGHINNTEIDRESSVEIFNSNDSIKSRLLKTHNPILVYIESKFTVAKDIKYNYRIVIYNPRQQY